MKNSAGRGGCYRPRPSASVDNILRDHGSARGSHLTLGSTSVHGRSLSKLKITLAARQCSLSSESFWWSIPLHAKMPYVTAGIMTLEYRFKRSFLGENLFFFIRLSLLAKLLF